MYWKGTARSAACPRNGIFRIKRYIIFILFMYLPVFSIGDEYVFEPLKGMSLQEAIDNGSIAKVFDCYISMIDEKPYSQKSYFYMTYSLPDFVYLLEDSERRGTVKVAWVKQLQDYITNIRNLNGGKKEVAAKIVMAHALLESSLHQDPKTVEEIFENIIKDEKLRKYHPLCLLKKNEKHIETEYLEKLSNDYKELKLILQIRNVRGRIIQSEFMSKEREELVAKWFSYAVSQEIDKISFYDNPFPIYEAYTATQCLSDTETQINNFKLLLKLANDTNDPPRLGREYRTDICGDLADIYYEKRDLPTAKYYLAKGLKYGKTMHICIVEEKINRDNKHP